MYSYRLSSHLAAASLWSLCCWSAISLSVGIVGIFTVLQVGLRAYVVGRSYKLRVAKCGTGIETLKVSDWHRTIVTFR